MRRVLVTRTGVRAGDLVRISASLKGDAPQARLGLWSCEPAYGADAYSPHCPISELGPDDLQMVTPTRMNLCRVMRPRGEIAFRAHAPLNIRMVQDISAADEPAPAIRISVHGKTRQRIQRLLDRAGWFAGRFNEALASAIIRRV